MKEQGSGPGAHGDRMQRFAGMGALVTGGSRGIGKAVALGLAAEGARVAVAAQRAASAQAAAQTIRAAGGQGTAIGAGLMGTNGLLGGHEGGVLHHHHAVGVGGVVPGP